MMRRTLTLLSISLVWLMFSMQPQPPKEKDFNAKEILATMPNSPMPNVASGQCAECHSFSRLIKKVLE